MYLTYFGQIKISVCLSVDQCERSGRYQRAKLFVVYLFTRVKPWSFTSHIQVKDDVRVEAGDIVGFYFPSFSVVPFNGTEGCGEESRVLYHKVNKHQLPTVGNTYTFKIKTTGRKTCRFYSFRIIISGKFAFLSQSTNVCSVPLFLLRCDIHVMCKQIINSYVHDNHLDALADARRFLTNCHVSV